MLKDFPVAPVDPLQPNTQGEVLRCLRAFTKLCVTNAASMRNAACEIGSLGPVLGVHAQPTYHGKRPKKRWPY